MDSYVILLLLLFGCSPNSCTHFPPREYHYINTPMTWTDAQQYCREKYTDLATIDSVDDINMVKPGFDYTWAWIGLWDDPRSWKRVMANDSNSWRWSATGETSKTGFQQWDASEPNGYGANENCVAIRNDAQWYDLPCETLHGFVCFTVTEQNEIIYDFISNATTWRSARDYCRQHHTDLAMIENSEENLKVFSVKPADALVWIGLYRVQWVWSDMSQSSFRDWIFPEPNNFESNEYCVAKNKQHKLADGNCQTVYPFICHQVLSLRTVVRITIKSDVDQTDANNNAQILERLAAVLKRHGWTDVKLQWKTPPKKLKKKQPKEV